MSYDIAIASRNNSITTSTITGTAGGKASGATFSPDGTKFAVITERVNGAAATSHGVDIYTKSNSTWSRTEHIVADFDASIHQVVWYSNTEIWLTALAGATDNGGIYRFTTDANESGGWSASSTLIIDNGSQSENQLTRLILSPDKTKGVLWTWNKGKIKVIEVSNSTWSDTLITPALSNSHISSATWYNNSKFVIAVSRFGDLTTATLQTEEFRGSLMVYELSGGSWTKTETDVTSTTNSGGNANTVPQAVYYDPKSNSLLVWLGSVSATGQQSASTSGVIKVTHPKEDQTLVLTADNAQFSSPGGTLSNNKGFPNYNTGQVSYGHYITPDPNNTSRLIFQTVNESTDTDVDGSYSTSKLYSLEWEFVAVDPRNRWVLTELASGYGTDTNTFDLGFGSNGEIIVNSGNSVSDDLLMLFSDGEGFLEESRCDDNYPVCHAISTNTRNAGDVVASNAAAELNTSSQKNYPYGGVPSPNGEIVAVFTSYRNGADATDATERRPGIDFYTLGNSGWELTDSIATEADNRVINVQMMQWRDNDELWYLAPNQNGNFPAGLCKTVASNGTFQAPVKAANEDWVINNAGLRFTSGQIQAFVFNENKDLCFAWFQNRVEYIVLYENSQTQTSGEWDGIVFTGRATTSTDVGNNNQNAISYLTPGKRDGTKQIFYISAVKAANSPSVWAKVLDLSQWPTPNENNEVFIATNAATNGNDFTVDLDTQSGRRTFALNSQFTEPTTETDPWLMKNGDITGKRLVKPSPTYDFENTANGLAYLGTIMYYHTESDKLLLFSAQTDVTGFRETLTGGSGTGGYNATLYELATNRSNVVGYDNKIFAFEQTSDSDFFQNPEEILPSIKKPSPRAALLPAWHGNQFFYGFLDETSRSPVKKFGSRIACLEYSTVNTDWRLSTFPRTQWQPTQIGYADGTLVTNNLHVDTTPATDPSPNLLMAQTSFDDATFRVETFDLTGAVDPAITVTSNPSPAVLSEATPGTTVSATVTLNTDPGADTVNVVASLSSGTDISVDTSSQQITTNNYENGVVFVFTVTDDSFDEDTETVTVTFTTQDSANADLNGLTTQLSIEVQDDDTAGITTSTENLTIVETEEQQIANISISLDSEPTSNVVLSVATTLDANRVSVPLDNLTFDPVDHPEQKTLRLTIPGNAVDQDDHSGTITLSVIDGQSAAEFATLTKTINVTLQEDDVAQINISPAGPISLAEGESSDITVSLNSEPSSNVEIDVQAAAALAGRINNLDTTLVFTPQNYSTARTITVQAVQDSIDNDAVTANITFTVDTENSANEYNLPQQTVEIQLSKDATDVAGITVTSDNPINLNESAPGNSATITVELDSQPASGVVVIDIDTTALAGRATLAGATLANSRLQFTTENWNTPQTVTLTAVSDDIDKDPITNADLVFSVNDDLTADAKFDPLSHTVQVNITDDDTANFTVTSDDPINLTEGGAAAQITVVLTSEPESGAVRIDISPQGDLVGRITTPTHVDFDDTNWDIPKTISVSVPEDQEANADASGILRFAINAAASSDEFDALPSHDVTVNITADATDVAGLDITPADFRVVTKEEGETTATLTVKLKSAPTHPVTITLTGLDATEHRMTPNPVSFQFDENNFSNARAVTFQGIEDNQPVGDSVYTMTLTATSDDPEYSIVQEITLVNEDSGIDENAGAPEDDDGDNPEDPPGDGGGDEGDEGGDGDDDAGDPVTPPGGLPPVEIPDPFAPGPRSPQAFSSGFTGIVGSVYQPQEIDDKIPRKIHFEPSTIESIDTAVYEYISKLSLSTDTNEGFIQVPVVWGTSERSFLSKREPLERDNQGLLKLPVITIRRTGIEKSLSSKGAFQGNVPENPDEQGGSLVVARVVNQEKTSAYAESLRKRTTLGRGAPIVSNKTVFRTVSAPMPVNVEMTYDIMIRTEYQQQMNDLVLPFATKTGTINYVKLKSNGHRYEGFIDGAFSSQDNLSEYTNAERKFETIIKFRVVGYLVGQGKNREKPHFSIRENFVEVKIPRESVVVDPKEIDKYKL